SVVTPNFNYGRYLEETIRSVLLQGYPNLEYIIIDGGSTDNSLEIITKYEAWLTHWVRERDRGQSHAINKGMRKATGDLRAYLNSDDYYLPNAFRRLAELHDERPGLDLLHGHCRVVDSSGRKTGVWRGSIRRYDEILDLWGVWWNKRNFVQPE